MSITAVIPVWNGRELLAKLFTSLESQTRQPAEVLVVDNGSADGAPEFARTRGARVISMGTNVGFAAAVNRGIRESRTEWIAVLNSDVTLAADYLDKLTTQDRWFATGKILSANSSGQIDGTFDAVCRGGTAWRVGAGRSDGLAFHQLLGITSPPWTAAVFRAELFQRIGVLEECFESYLEDVDFGLRCAAHGMEGVYDPSAVAWHLGSAALGRWHPDTVRRIARNQIWLLARHYPTRLLWRWIWPVLTAHLLWGAVATRHGGGVAWAHGVLQGLRGFSRLRARNTPIDEIRLTSVLTRGEQTIHELQRSTGFDAYWRLYFLLSGAK